MKYLKTFEQFYKESDSFINEKNDKRIKEIEEEIEDTYQVYYKQKSNLQDYQEEDKDAPGGEVTDFRETIEALIELNKEYKKLTGKDYKKYDLTDKKKLMKLDESSINENYKDDIEEALKNLNKDWKYKGELEYLGNANLRVNFKDKLDKKTMSNYVGDLKKEIRDVSATGDLDMLIVGDFDNGDSIKLTPKSQTNAG